jgi:predicted TIM-barrel fold metal-dependent hydrolase
VIPANRALFETDFPHPTCLYPNSLERAAEPLADLEPGVRRKILSTNAAKLYRIPLPDASSARAG